ncbi:transketolase family protein [Methylocystis bryophila]|uniref:Transketolase n=1 Tax=Methylocystis bryophila TaxID=655015 RepID=A0A1W6N063_9HYPH|nr:transketolase C-terminal domain-containing protein [Methylocystis bryophila]ARN83218.1 transketolase [Methylocystis bryophila]BDV39560.1 transketolase [Methylocystis bryophila]
MRNAFADELTRLGDEDPRLVMLSGDIGNRLFDKFRAAHGDRFFNCGVAEQNMMGLAAGLALSGYRPIAYTITPFVTTRCLEQIRTDVCYHEAPVIIVGVGSGLSYAGLGPTHHSCEDIALLRALPGLAVVCPCDAFEVRAALRAALHADHPTYLRLGKKGEPKIHGETPTDFSIGKALTIREGRDVCLLATGTILPEALHAADALAAAGVSAQVVSFHTVKPLDTERLRDAFATFRLVATIEEHSVVGGFGSAVAEWVVDSVIAPRAFLRFGTPDAFFKLAGEQEFARERLGLTGEQIALRIKERLSAA